MPAGAAAGTVGCEAVSATPGAGNIDDEDDDDWLMNEAKVPPPRFCARLSRSPGLILDAIEERSELDGTVVVLTADHGGTGRGHSNVRQSANHTIPFVVWGDSVRAGDLYGLSGGVRRPGSRRPGYSGKQPIRNGDLGNVVTDLLGLDPIPGSRLNRKQSVGARAW